MLEANGTKREKLLKFNQKQNLTKPEKLGSDKHNWSMSPTHAQEASIKKNFGNSLSEHLAISIIFIVKCSNSQARLIDLDKQKFTIKNYNANFSFFLPHRTHFYFRAIIYFLRSFNMQKCWFRKRTEIKYKTRRTFHETSSLNSHANLWRKPWNFYSCITTTLQMETFVEYSREVLHFKIMTATSYPCIGNAYCTSVGLALLWVLIKVFM